MRFLHCADLHIGSGGNEAAGCDCLSRLADAAIAARVDAMLIAGDLFDRAARYPQAAEAAAPALARLRAAGVCTSAIEGNHDILNNKCPSCLALLHAEGLLYLLRPVYDTAGEPRLSEYDGKTGCIATVAGVRIAGFGFMGGATRARLKALTDLLAPYEGFTVGMLHSGVYPGGALPQGGIRPADIAACAGKVDYFALGHRHAREEHAQGFNPGSPNGVRLKDPLAERGYYIVDVQGKVFRAEFVSTAAAV